MSKNIPGDLVRVLELLAIKVEELVPAVDVRRHISQFLTLTIFSENRGTSVLEDFPISNMVLVEPSPHGESISGFRLSAAELISTEVKFLREPVRQNLLELDGKVDGVFIVRPRRLAPKVRVGERSLCG